LSRKGVRHFARNYPPNAQKSVRGNGAHITINKKTGPRVTHGDSGCARCKLKRLLDQLEITHQRRKSVLDHVAHIAIKKTGPRVTHGDSGFSARNYQPKAQKPVLDTGIRTTAYYLLPLQHA
jgi:hypothetical protein